MIFRPIACNGKSEAEIAFFGLFIFFSNENQMQNK